MEISSNFNIGSIQGSKPAARSNAPESAPETSIPAPVDHLDLSPEAQALSQSSEVASSSSDIRTDKVAALRRAIADGTYETPDRLSGALDRLLEQIG